MVVVSKLTISQAIIIIIIIIFSIPSSFFSKLSIIYFFFSSYCITSWIFRCLAKINCFFKKNCTFFSTKYNLYCLCLFSNIYIIILILIKNVVFGRTREWTTECRSEMLFSRHVCLRCIAWTWIDQTIAQLSTIVDGSTVWFCRS